MHCVYTVSLQCCRRGDTLFPKNPDGMMHFDYTDYKETWKAMEKLVEKGLVKAIGLSNFNSRQIDDIISMAAIKPAVLQVRQTQASGNGPLCERARSVQERYISVYYSLCRSCPYEE